MNQSPSTDQHGAYLSDHYLKSLLLSSLRFQPSEHAQTGKIDVFEILDNLNKEDNGLNCVELTSRPPSKKLILEWKEVATPQVPSSMRDLVGKKLASCKFQYFGKFHYGEDEVNVSAEHFAASFQNGEAIYDCTLESEGWVNCTWLVDFLMNAATICQDSLRQEQLHWHKEGKKGHFLNLSSVETDSSSQEQQYFVFKDDYQTLEWSNSIQFPAKKELPRGLGEAV